MDYHIVWATQIMTGQDEINSLKDNKFEKRQILSELKAIWRECFRDSDEYIDFFLRHRFTAENTILAIYNQQIIGSIYLLPVTIHTEQGELPAVFGYALGVRKAFRGQGIGIKIIDLIRRYCDENNASYLFYPANIGLSAYYKRIGLKEAGNIRVCIFHYSGKEQRRDVRITDITSQEYTGLRNTYLQNSIYAKWDEAAIAYALAENSFCGGFCKKLEYRNKEYAILGCVMDEKLLITEAILPDNLISELFPIIASYFRKPTITAYLPESSHCVGTVIPWIMGYKADILKKGYCGLLLN